MEHCKGHTEGQEFFNVYQIKYKSEIKITLNIIK